MSQIGRRATDYSDNFSKLRPFITSSEGQPLTDFVKLLTPRFYIVYRDIAFGYTMLFGALAVILIAENLGVPGWPLVIMGAPLIGYWFAYLHLFIHEGAHWNLASDRKVNDRICDMLISWWVGQKVSDYRLVHFQHHRALGTMHDSENTYFFPLNLIFVIKGLFGLRAVETLIARKKLKKNHQMDRAKEKWDGQETHYPLALGILLHAAITGTLAYLGNYATVLAWIAGVGLFFPFYAALRQLLEHRSEDALPDADYHEVSHGALTRMFDDGAIARTFGGVGFNRHLLHHWEPNVSYTRLADLERFLMGTSVRGIMEKRKTTYFNAVKRLFRVRR